MSNLRNDNLRPRDIIKLVNLKMHSINWEAGFEKGNEWVFASLESEQSKSKLISWLRSKDLNENSEALWIKYAWEETKIINFTDLIENPDTYFGQSAFKLVSLDFYWALDYIEQEVARFGRWL